MISQSIPLKLLRNPPTTIKKIHRIPIDFLLSCMVVCKDPTLLNLMCYYLPFCVQGMIICFGFDADFLYNIWMMISSKIDICKIWNIVWLLRPKQSLRNIMTVKHLKTCTFNRWILHNITKTKNTMNKLRIVLYLVDTRCHFLFSLSEKLFSVGRKTGRTDDSVQKV